MFLGHSSVGLMDSSLKSNGLYMFKCRLCSYQSLKVTIMRHHVMSHLLYHPYKCPYCDLVHSVKSSPVTKHIRAKHPGKELRFKCLRDNEMEKQVLNMYTRTPLDGSEPLPETAARLPKAQHLHAATTEHRYKPSRKAFYRCHICGLVTQIRTDMKHHLMREIHYKPYRCGHCEYAEPSRSAMGKHFRSKHAGMVIDIRDALEPARDAEVEKMLNECSVKGTALEDDIAEQTYNTFKLQNRSTPATPRFSFAASKCKTINSVLAASRKLMNAKQHKCPHCSYANFSLKAMQQHVLVKHRPCRLQCGYCDHRSHYPSWIVKHIATCHPGMETRYTKVSSCTPVQCYPISQSPQSPSPIGVQPNFVQGKSEPEIIKNVAV